ncbi:MAG: alpha-glucan family phosphorylase [Thermoguttaceae bacterium]
MSFLNVQRPLPKPLERLAELAFDLRLIGSKTMSQIWRRLDAESWSRCNNPYMILQNAHQKVLDEAAGDEVLIRELQRWLQRQDQYMKSPGWFGTQHAQSELRAIAYFSMEFGLAEALPIYSGGLGILAGDHLKSASDLNVPVVGIGLLYQQGYFRQVLADDGWQLEAFPFNDPGSLPITPVLDADGRWPRVRLELPGRTLYLRVWNARVGKVNLYLLDSNHPLNSPWDRGITANLYAAGKEKRLLQELVLGIGGWRLLEMLGVDPQVCHLNEGHAAFAVLARAQSFAEKNKVPFPVALRATRAGNVFTTHTPVEAAFDRFEPVLVTKAAEPFVRETGLSNEAFLALGRRDPADSNEPFNMAYLAMRGSCHVNGVARLHGKVSQRLFHVLFPGWPQGEIPVSSVTNGVHIPTWHSEPANQLWSEAYGVDGPWLGNVGAAAKGIEKVSDERLWDYRAEARKTLVDYVRLRLQRQLRERNAPEAAIQKAQRVLDPNRITLGFARRFAEYKRPNLLLDDQERFIRILRNVERPMQIVVAGKAHPDDNGGKAMVQRVVQFARRDDVREHVVFLEDYDMVLAQHFAAGIDVWINNPRRPAEACGTSGMKMLVNGGLHCSILDGWWDEAYTPEVGWQFGGTREHSGEHDHDDACELYDLLEHAIAPEFYDRDHLGVPRAWMHRVRASMTQLTEQFSSDRMVREYVEQAYLPAARAFLRRSADGARLAQELEAWSALQEERWHGVRFDRLFVHEAEQQWQFEVEVYLGEVCPDSAKVQLYAEAAGAQPAACVTIERSGPIHGAVNGYLYRGSVPASRPAKDYTPRVVPCHPEAFVPVEAAHITWRN